MVPGVGKGPYDLRPLDNAWTMKIKKVNKKMRGGGGGLDTKEKTVLSGSSRVRITLNYLYLLPSGPTVLI